jgi:murein DD-endopeptidase MepM/ murein hydrolase activator NlpD
VAVPRGPPSFILTRRILATGLAGAALFAASLGALARGQDPSSSPTPDATATVETTATSVPTTVPTETPTEAPTSTPAATQTADPSPYPSPVQTTVPADPTSTPSDAPTATSTPGSTATPGATATPGSHSHRSAHSPAKGNTSRGSGSIKKGCGSASSSDRGCGKTSKPAHTDPAPSTPAAPTPPTTNADGSPAPSNPTFSLSTPGPAPIGVPNFFIDKFRIPPFLLPIYQAAGMQYGIRWEVLAAINEIETDYGRNLNISSAGALGWMQFMPATWKMYGVDANHDGEKDPFNPVDAVFAAARYLKAAGGDHDLRRAIFAYNHADWYVNSVLMRAQVIGGLPSDLVGSLTGLTQGRFPIAAKATYAGAVSRKRKVVGSGNAAMVVESSATQRSIDIFSKDRAPVIAVNDGRVVKLGTNKRLGHFIRVQDVYGNTYTYANLGSVSATYPAPKPRSVRKSQVRRELHLPGAGKAPKKAASTSRRAAKPAAKPRKAMAAAAPVDGATALKQRLFAHPTRPHARANGGAIQLGESLTTPAKLTTRAPIGLDPKDFVAKKMRKGARIIGGTILGRLGKKADGIKAHLRFEIRPAGRGAPRIDPKPILDGWKLLESTAIYRAAGKNPFFGQDAQEPSIGQILLMSKETLTQRVLNDPRVQIYQCGRQDIESGQIDRRVLAMLEFLATSGLKPTVSALKCGHSLMTVSGNISEHSTGTAADIAAINGIPIVGHQGPGSITDITIQRLLTLQGTMKPHQIISLMTFQGADNTLAMADHYDHIHVGYHPMYGQNTKASKQIDAILKPDQWIKLISRLGQIDNPTVADRPSRYSVKVVKRASTAHAGE